jgi:CYTH domain-containing protein
MPVARRFLISSSLARLVQKECGAERVVEGHFTPQSGRQSHIRLESSGAYLVLLSLDAEAEAAEDRSDLPSAHGKALLEVCPGTIVLDRSVLPLPATQALIDRITAPGQLDLVSVEFATQADAQAFPAPLWFGAEVTDEPAYRNWKIALSGVPHAPETDLSNEALEAALDVLESIPSAVAGKARPDAPASSDTIDSPEPLRAGGMMGSVVSMPTAASLPVLAAEDARRGNSGQRQADRPVLSVAHDPEQDGDERIASLFEDLAAAVSSSTIGSVHAAAEVREERKWRWSSH